jgi:hypothetical protein
MFSHAMLEVLTSLEGANIHAVPFKGPVLAQSAYGDVSLRMYNDVDILIPPPEYARAEAVLARLGYRAHGDTDVPDGVYRRTSHARSYRRPQASGILLEAHWSLAEEYFGFTLDAKELWPRIATVEVLQHSVPTLGSEDLLVLLCVHGAKHGWQRLAWALDVAALLRSAPHLEWNLVQDLAARHGVARIVDFGLHLANDLLGVPLLESMRRRIACDSTLPALGRQVWTWWEEGSSIARGESERSSLFPFHLRLRRRWHHKLAHILRIVFLPTVDDWRSFRVPARCFGLLTVARPFRLLLQQLRPLPEHGDRH